MKAQLADYKEKLDQAQSDLSAWKFTPDRLAFQRNQIPPRTSQHLSDKRINPVITELISLSNVLYVYYNNVENSRCLFMCNISQL